MPKKEKAADTKKKGAPDKELEKEPDSTQEADKETAEDTAENTQKEEEQTKEPVDEAPEAAEDDENASKEDSGKDKKDEKIEELNDQLLRNRAEFDNFRKRTEKEKTQMFETGAKSIIEKVLPVMDSFERALDTVPDDEKENPFVDGMNKVYKQMATMLEEAGVTVIEAVGKEFDPNIHNAVMHIDDDSFGENEIVEEFQKGYMYRESVVRHSMVKVAN